eukprot:scaffold20028_cov106-Isochrysis_galbana.AAC.6
MPPPPASIRSFGMLDAPPSLSRRRNRAFAMHGTLSIVVHLCMKVCDERVWVWWMVMSMRLEGGGKAKAPRATRGALTPSRIAPRALTFTPSLPRSHLHIRFRVVVFTCHAALLNRSARVSACACACRRRAHWLSSVDPRLTG